MQASMHKTDGLKLLRDISSPLGLVGRRLSWSQTHSDADIAWFCL
jgi:hypothetical protein